MHPYTLQSLIRRHILISWSKLWDGWWGAENSTKRWERKINFTNETFEQFDQTFKLRLQGYGALSGFQLPMQIAPRGRIAQSAIKAIFGPVLKSSWRLLWSGQTGWASTDPDAATPSTTHACAPQHVGYMTIAPPQASALLSRHRDLPFLGTVRFPTRRVAWS